MKPGVLLSILFSLVHNVWAADDEYPSDPYLTYRPAFARSLPVQIMLTGVVLTLVAVLLIHLLFTAQYHWPLAPVNYVLQLSGVTTLLISLIATIHVVLSSSLAESEKWPYMLNYIAVNVPPMDLETNDELWSTAERATWLVMNASTSGLIQITHIQFLTLLYPSRLEGRLIFALLGPLAIVAAIMQLLPISNNADVNLRSTDVRNVCNATLSLLFTLALFIWGLLVNRKQAWRTDGGTAAFGCAALSLAVISTALNFLYVHKEEEFVWLPSLMWAVVLWQSFLGWWWWVGAGSGRALSGEYDMEEKLQREAKRARKKKEARERRKETKMKAQKMWKGVAGAFVPGTGSGGLRSRTASISPPPADASGSADDAASQLSRSSEVTVTGTTTAQTHTTLPPFLPRALHRLYAALRREHNAAARVQAVQRVARMREMGRVAHHGSPEPPSVVGWGWGWHGFGWRRREVPEGDEDYTRGGKTGSRSASLRRRGTGAEYAMQATRWRGRREEPEDKSDDVYVSDEVEEEPVERERVPHAPRVTQAQAPPHTPLPPPVVVQPEPPSSIWWWGPLKRWRLQDSTTY
uniref:Uncharacterized protein n=1 Tax=Hypholoma sublateritium (strain FD-334 SS-4) TaxID=945553 RepID=A0A0D2QB06_HYPSF